MNPKMKIYTSTTLILLVLTWACGVAADRGPLEMKERGTPGSMIFSAPTEEETIWYSGFEPGDPLGVNFDYNSGASPDEWHVTQSMLYHGTSMWMTAPLGNYFCHIGDDTTGYSDGNDVGYQVLLDLTNYSTAHLYYLSAMQAYANSNFDKFVVWGTYAGLGTWINLDPGGGYAWGGDWGPYWYGPIGDTLISLSQLAGYPDVTIEFWFLSNTGNPWGFGVAIDEIVITGTSIPVAITLSSFTATAGPSQVILEWVTESERQNLGFNLLRRSSLSEPFSRINEQMIPAASGGDSEVPLHYLFVDRDVNTGVTYEYQLEDINFQGQSNLHGSIIATPTASGVSPQEFCLFQNCPNPFNTSTEIRYQIPKDGHVTLKIFNTLGQKVRTLLDADQRAGEYVLNWDGRDEKGVEMASGLYFYTINAGDLKAVKKMVLLK